MDYSLEDYLFDLSGYLVLKNAVEPNLIGDLNRAFDVFPDLPYQGWWGNVQRLDNNGYAGLDCGRHNIGPWGQISFICPFT